MVSGGAKRERIVRQSYSHKFRLQMIQRMVGPSAMSATALSAEVGVPQTTLSRWRREAGGTLTRVMDDNQKRRGKRPSDWTAEERFQAVLEASQLSDEELGAFLREKGLREGQLNEWRDAARRALRAPGKRRRRRTQQDKTIRALKSELQRKEKALAEAAALLVLQGKAEALWGAEGESTAGRSGKKRSS